MTRSPIRPDKSVVAPRFEMAQRGVITKTDAWFWPLVLAVTILLLAGLSVVRQMEALS